MISKTGSSLTGNSPAWIEALFNGENINHTEGRAVLHTALRDRPAAAQQTGKPVYQQIQA